MAFLFILYHRLGYPGDKLRQSLACRILIKEYLIANNCGREQLEIRLNTEINLWCRTNSLNWACRKFWSNNGLIELFQLVGDSQTFILLQQSLIGLCAISERGVILGRPSLCSKDHSWMTWQLLAGYQQHSQQVRQ